MPLPLRRTLGILALAGCAGTTAPVPEPSLGALQRVGDLTAARALHTATPLPDGAVLIAGGMGPAGAIRTAERYDPSTGRSGATGDMSTGRMSHTATLLPDGTVLIVGGYGSGIAGFATSELYDPATGRFAPAARLNEPRSDHAAVLLLDGRVLIAGGDTSGAGRTPTAAAELYDPATGRFTPTGSMLVPRVPYVAVRLRDGRVLVAGGTTTGKAVTRGAELYDPATGTFTPTGSLRTARRKHAGFLLPDGRVLVVGGTTGGDDSQVLRDGEMFDPATGTFAPAPRCSPHDSSLASRRCPTASRLRSAGPMTWRRCSIPLRVDSILCSAPRPRCGCSPRPPRCRTGRC